MVDEVWRAHLASIRPDADLAEADWWETQKDGYAPAAVGFLIPRGFEAYARVLHPASLNDEAGTLVSWAVVAEECGTTLHPEAQWWHIAGRADPYAHDGGWVGQNPCEGQLERTGFEALSDVLGRHTATLERTFVGFWNGYGNVPASWHGSAPVVSLGRKSYLFERRLVDVPQLCREAPAARWATETGNQAVMSFRSDGGKVSRPSDDELFELWASHEWQSPTEWWPADHAWVTSNDTDLDSTLIGGSRALVDDLLADDRLEVLPWPVDGSLWSSADTINQGVPQP